MIKLTDSGHNRILDGIKKYSRIVGQARQRGMNERDTADIVKAMLGDMLGYDPFFDVTEEISVRGNSADYAVLIDHRLQFLLNVKSLAVVPNASHLLRLSGSSAPPYAEWALLTNSDVWSCYRLGVGHDRHAEMVFRVSMLDPTPTEEKAALFYLISKEGVQEQVLDEYWERMRVLNPGRIASMLLSDDVLNLLRRELQRTANYRIDAHTLYALLVKDVLRPDALAARNGSEGDLPRLPQCFAYVRDPHDPNTWRLRYRNIDGTAHAELLTLALAELSGDSRALGIPADDIPLVRERLRVAFFDLGISPEELPDLLRG